jgi:hypothetical protein
VRRAALAAAAAAALGLAACGGGGGVEASLRLVVPDNNIREEGVECAGARPFRHVHRGTPYTIEDGTGAVVAEGELPPGRAENADPSIDWGVERIPTACVMALEVELPERQRYRLVIEGSVPVAFERALLDEEEPVRLVLSG